MLAFESTGVAASIRRCRKLLTNQAIKAQAAMIVADEFPAEARTILGMNPLAKINRKFLVSVLAFGILLLIFGELFFSSGRNAVEGSLKVLPTFLGLLLIVADGVLYLIWFVRRQRPTALEEGTRTNDRDERS